MSILRLGELFCGPGGLGLGAAMASDAVRHVWATDYDADSCATYGLNLADDWDNVLCCDVRTLRWSTLGRISAVDILTFGFPCNDFSVVGEQRGLSGKYGPLYVYCARALEYFKPSFFVAENVGGLRSADGGRAFEAVLGRFRKAGYSLYPHLYDFSKYGVPQARKRIVIVGVRRDIALVYRVPCPSLYSHIDVSCRTALECPPIPELAANQEPTKQSPAVIERLRHIKPGQNAFNADLPEHLKLNVKGATISQIYRRLDPDKPAYTITGSGGGGTHVYHWADPRALTNRERARLQSFPDYYEFCGRRGSVRKQIGMAVPPVGAKAIFKALFSCVNGVEYPWIEQNIKGD